MSDEKVPKQAYIVVPNDGVKRVAITRAELRTKCHEAGNSRKKTEKIIYFIFGEEEE